MIIVGLGNPGSKYEKTRHNAGFMFVDHVSKANQSVFKLKKDFEAEVAEILINNEKHILVKPITYMNNSGNAVYKVMNFYKTRRFISSCCLGTLGFGMGAAIGAQMGTGERTVLVTGDGGFGMSLNELATAVSNKTPIVILIFNNGVLGMVRQWQTLFFDKHYSNTILDRKTNFVKLAEAFGAKASSAFTLEELDKALKTAFEHNGPYLIDCAIDKDEFVLPMLPPGGSMDDIIVKIGD